VLPDCAIARRWCNRGHGRVRHNNPQTADPFAQGHRGRAGHCGPSPGLHDDERSAIATLGGCDPVVVQAAASARVLGHSPFGHLGEQVLDRVTRERLGLADGFEGNAETFRILPALDTSDATERELNLTAAVRAAVLKYPWTRGEWQTADVLQPPRGEWQTADVLQPPGLPRLARRPG
jgi:hypothetical protein